MVTDQDVAAPELVACIGLDWGDERHAVHLQAAEGGPVERVELEQKPDVLHAWVAQVRERFHGRPVGIAIEQRKGAVMHALMMYEFFVLYPVNPKALARYREAFRTSGAKDDPADAELLLDLLRKHRDQLRPWLPDTVEARTLQSLCEQRRKLVNHRVALTNRITSLLKQYFPQALDWVGDVASLQGCDFLRKWPDLAAVQRVRPSTLRTFYQQHNCRKATVIDERIRQIASACPLTSDPAIVDPLSLSVQTYATQLRVVIEAVQAFDTRIAHVFAHHPDQALFDSFPGAGPVCAPRLAAAFGTDRSRWQSATDLQSHSGIAPVTERSGKALWVHHRLACPKFVKQTFHEFADQSIRFSQWARAYYDQQRSRGNDHHAALRALAYKWIRILFRCWKDRKPYDEATYMDALRRHGSSLVKNNA
jgi:transposase